MNDNGGYPPIGDYAIVGDCRSAGLISTGGSLDWLCWPRFDSPSIFAALLDERRGGRFRIGPVGPFTTSRRYIGDSAVLETTFRTPTGVVRLTDLMPVASEADKARDLWPEHELLRHVRCESGTAELEALFDPRPDYGRVIPALADSPPFGLLCEHGRLVIGLRSEVPLSQGPGPGARARFRLSAGESCTFSITCDHGLPLVLLPAGRAAADRIADSVSWWAGWMHQCRYGGPHAALVRRSAITLKLMTYAPSGAVVAAPTTSLPETIGGERNWDYRYCWLRDASLTLQAFADLGFTAESEAFLSWLLHATRLTQPDLQVMYDVYGETRLPESVLGHLEGYARSAPVRAGNAATGQFQLDTYGTVIDAAWRYVLRGGRLDRTTARALIGFGETVLRRWREPDEGIWEPRSGRRQRTHSKAMCWVAADRLLRLAERGEVRPDIARLARAREEIRDAIETHGYDGRLNSYVSEFGGGTVDASLLLLSILGYADPRSPRMRGTLRQVRERLAVGDLLFRYRDENDGLSGGEGAFGICSFWAVAASALEGDVGRAGAAFDRLVSYANDVGLFAEEIDVESGAPLGNFPQAFTHVGLIHAARVLEEAAGRSGD